ncbi:MAG: UDP-N-acetylmuramoyl-L-alanine--D-glutamate ligase, partial [Kiritimatiellae bacterium]|nr:UDP-N-acetylmuramoyl-L-alanine--D-glutamate ligase [Kiritimatiellia bacterium]
VLDGDDVWPGGAWDLCVTSPGIPLDHPWQAAARAAGVKVVSELQLGASRWKGRTLAVTGSKGKSSVVKLIADTLNLAGVPAVPCGNYGTPLCEVVNRSGGEADVWAVVEVSSFQMETTDGFRPDAAAILNLQEDHLDRHGSVEAYHALKRKLLAGARQAFACDLEALGRLKGSKGLEASKDIKGLKDLKAPKDLDLLRGSCFDNEILRPNGLIAIALMRVAGLDDVQIADGFRAFEPLPHRMQLVAERGGVRYVDDSKATSLAALAAGVAMCGGPVRLVAGGLAKGDDPKSVIPRLLSAVKKVYLIGRCADQFLSAWREAVPCEVCGTLDRAVEAARRDAVAGETVLLSPGAASFDQFDSYGVRGDAFASFVCAEARRGETGTTKQG